MHQKTYEIEFIFDDSNHETGYLDCKSCWREGKICRKCGQGVVHNEIGSENRYGEQRLFTKCDNCGEPE